MSSNFRKFFYLTLVVLIISFIFYNSSQNGEQSSNTSRIFLNFINNFLKSIGSNFTMEGFLLRKIAHFIEYFALGLSLMFTFEAFSGKTLKIIVLPLFICLLTAVLDEYTQLFSVGRSSEVRDILINFSGAITGIFYVILWIFIKNNFILKRKKSTYYYNLKI